MEISKTTTALITGASSGIGAALAKDLVTLGARVSICARRAPRLAALADELRAAGGDVHLIAADVSLKGEAERAVDETVERFGSIDILVNNAGRGNRASVEDTTPEMLESIFGVNVYSLWYTTARALPHMKRRNRGHIINISSIVGKIAYPFNSAYVAAKHAVVGFNAALRAELAGTAIEATVVCPAGVETEWASVTEGGAIGDIFFHGIQKSRRIAREQGMELAPLQPMKSPAEISSIILGALLNPPDNDLFTHPGTAELALLAAENRRKFEEKNMALYLGMKEAYHEIVKQDNPA